MNTKFHIQAAHDVLHAVVTRQLPVEFSQHDLDCAHAAHDALAFALGFECGDSTRRMVVQCMKWAKENGYVVRTNGDARAAFGK